MDFIITILYLWLTLFLQCGASEEHRISKRLVHSDEVQSINEFPFMASIHYLMSFPLDEPNHFCAGAIISEYWVLTVAECFSTDRRVHNWGVRVGDVDPFEGSYHQLDKIIVHPTYAQSGTYIVNDIAPARVKTSFFLNNPNVRAIGIGKIPDRRGIRVQTAGWGFTKSTQAIWDSSLFAPRLRKLNTRTKDARSCSQVLKKGDTFKICVDGRTTCRGDAGNPLITIGSRRLVGLAMTHTLLDCSENVPVLFARLSSHIYWLRDATGLELPLY